MNVFLSHISQLVTVAAHGARVKTGGEMRSLQVIEDGAVLCENGRITWVGRMDDPECPRREEIPTIDADGKSVFPGFVDSHTHMVFAGSRVNDFAMRCAGRTYQEIAGGGGGIVSTMSAVRAASKKELKRHAGRVLTDMMRHGTTTVEIKSGYGLDVANEMKMLDVIQELKQEEMMNVVGTFMGAHAIPPEFRQDPAAYVRMVIEDMLPLVARKDPAVFCDVFCEEGFFSLDDSRRILESALALGLPLKVHADEITSCGGAELAARLGAVSADHLEKVSREGIRALAKAGTVAVVLPGVSFFLNHGYAPARDLIDAGVPVAIATDFNPGSCMSYSMPLMMTIACTQMKMTIEEAITAATLNAAAALGLSSTTGSIEPGKVADLVVCSVPDYRYLAYHFGTNHVVMTIKNGTILEF